MSRWKDPSPAGARLGTPPRGSVHRRRAARYTPPEGRATSDRALTVAAMQLYGDEQGSGGRHCLAKAPSSS
jgi:hypothetical protein